MGEELKIRNLSILSIIMGVFLCVLLIVPLRTTLVSNKIDYARKQVQSLICTFEEIEYQVKDVISNATLETLTHVNITADTQFYRFFTRDVSQVDFVDMGMIHWEDRSLFVIAPEKLENNAEYVIEDGIIIELYHYGFYQEKEYCVNIVAVRHTNWLDKIISTIL